mmetsp:Transcript_28163/g.71799  ORF Transcript_28163/g.71799 Transcript_28163/m.71799 type:complete len:214 (-) Transcript_28163:771-1412(-)
MLPPFLAWFYFGLKVHRILCLHSLPHRLPLLLHPSLFPLPTLSSPHPPTPDSPSGPAPVPILQLSAHTLQAQSSALTQAGTCQTPLPPICGCCEHAPTPRRPTTSYSPAWYEHFERAYLAVRTLALAGACRDRGNHTYSNVGRKGKPARREGRRSPLVACGICRSAPPLSETIHHTATSFAPSFLLAPLPFHRSMATYRTPPSLRQSERSGHS